MAEEVKTPAADAAPKVSGKEGDAPVTEKVAEVKTSEPAKPIVPEKYELKIPDGSVLEEGAIQRISSYAKEKGLTNEQAQSLLNRESEAVSGYNQKLIEQHKNTVSSWAEQVKSDKEIGGDNYKKSVELASRLVKKFGDESFQKDLDTSGYGNHPGLVKLLTRIARSMDEDQLTVGGTTNPKEKIPLEDRLYGSKN